ncbi:hypothetical protein C8R47DRAFT_1142493 [Mycena vitilis]|nr:hypothetical protein C8R47DRAFT_1142493 [Mycena vitilis]
MAVTTLESQRRNSIVILETLPCKLPHLPPPPYSRDPPPFDVRNLHKVPRLMSCPRWHSSQSTRRLRLDAVQRAFLNHSRLFTPNSCFSSRTLPPPGLRACNLDGAAPPAFKRGDPVRVRRLNVDGERASLSEWQRGEVVGYVPMRCYIGNFGHAYCVRVVQSGQETEQLYVHFIGEVSPDDDVVHEEDSYSAEEYKKRRQKANYIYTRIPSAKTISGIPQQDVWTPAEVLAWERHGRIYVRSLAGPTAGRKYMVKDAIPYTLETAIACRKQAQNILGPDGKLFLTDIAIKPLENPAAPSSNSPFHLPPLSAITAPNASSRYPLSMQ